MRDRVAVVTGVDAPLGVGAATARALARQGCRVVLVSEPGDGVSGADHVRDALRTAGAVAESLSVELAGPAAASRVFDHAEEVAGPVEVLVTTVGHRVPDTFRPDPGRGQVPFDAAGLDAHFARNARAPALLVAEFHRRHLRRGADWGRVVTVSADTAGGAAGEVSHAAALSALESLARSAAVELGPAGITVNIVAPGPVQTGWLSPEARARAAELSPLGRVGHPEDIADLVVFLASHQARWVTGQTIFAGGGKRML
ncbi:SDR family oxidoreductase [Saccharopolyspora hordei]|nr:SDR family oxidoreductase [Saccharopolyspora hordei]